MTMKKTLFVILALLSAIGSKAQTYSIDSLYFTVTDETAKTVSLTKVTSKDSLVKIPEYVYIKELGAKYTVTDISVKLKLDAFRIKALSIPKSVKTISKLSGNSLRHIHFEDGSNIKSISGIESVNGLEDINIPGSVDSISAQAFYRCANLTKLELGEGVKYIGNRAFEASPIEELILPASIDSIGDYAFAHAKRVVPKRATPPRISEKTFRYLGYSSLYSDATISLSSLGMMIIYQDNEMWGKLNYEDYVFEQDYVKYKLERNHDLTVVGNTVPKEGKLIIPAIVTQGGYTVDVKHINDYALNCNASEIIVNAPVKSLGVTGEVNLNSYNISKYTYNYTYPFGSLKKITLPSTLERIEDFQFCNAPLESIDIPLRVDYIGNGAFYNTDIKEIVIPEGIDTLRSCTFANCSSLSKVKLPESLKVIEGDKIIEGLGFWGQGAALIYPPFYFCPV